MMGVPMMMGMTIAVTIPGPLMPWLMTLSRTQEMATEMTTQIAVISAVQKTTRRQADFGRSFTRLDMASSCGSRAGTLAAIR